MKTRRAFFSSISAVIGAAAAALALAITDRAIVVHRIRHAPERRVFYIDVGTMSSEQAKSLLEMIKNEIHQRRIPV